MKFAFTRFILILAVLAVAAVILPVSSVSEEGEDPAEFSDTDSYIEPPLDPYPWWEIYPPVQRRRRVKVSQTETMIESIPAEGLCYTAINWVNVRSQPSTQANRVMTIRSAGTEFSVSARVKNSSGEIWYAVKLANGTLGYIRSDLLNTDHVILLEDPYSYESEIDTHPAAASESGSDVINIISTPEPTPEIVYVTTDPSLLPTPTPILVYVTPDPASLPTPQVIYINPDNNYGQS
jgi:uncharacterized protein YgiM (DUF1202 family)